eukprot:GEMP01059425.1.p1 GENE.GEMP01059425.1~~GEMP01059425.1.p1  ORF type:complete len:203 (+),score=36.91 GEMP01059425.1:71-679(+)
MVWIKEHSVTHTTSHTTTYRVPHNGSGPDFVTPPQPVQFGGGHPHMHNARERHLHHTVASHHAPTAQPHMRPLYAQRGATREDETNQRAATAIGCFAVPSFPCASQTGARRTPSSRQQGSTTPSVMPQSTMPMGGEFTYAQQPGCSRVHPVPTVHRGFISPGQHPYVPPQHRVVADMPPARTVLHHFPENHVVEHCYHPESP